MKLLRLNHIPELHLVRGPEPDGVHLRIHAVELFRFESLFLNEGLLLSDHIADLLHPQRSRNVHKIPHDHGLHSHTHIDHLFDIAQI